MLVTACIGSLPCREVRSEKFFQNLKKLYSTTSTKVNPSQNAQAAQSASVVVGKAFPKAVTVFSGLLDCGHAAVRTWFALRALSTQGWVDIRVSDIANWLGCDRSVIYKHLADKVFFPQVYKVGKNIRVYLGGIHKVAIALGYMTAKSLGACTEFDPKWLGRHSLAVLYGTELEAQQGQSQAYFTALNSEGANEDKIINPAKAVKVLSKKEQVLTNARDRRRKELGRSIVLSGFRPKAFRYFRIGHDQSVPGITQKELSKRLNRSEQTIQRRLSNRTRVRAGIAPITRRRVIQKLTPDVQKRFTEYLDHINANYASVTLGDRTIQIGRITIGNEPPTVFRLLTNVYEFNFPLLSAKRARSRVNRLAKTLEERAMQRRTA
jgi:hypothetical protein